MLDSDLATLYGVETKVLNQAVKRNIQRFPETFMFQLTRQEYANLMSQFVTSSGEPLRSQFVTLENNEILKSQIATSSAKPLRSQIATIEDGKGRHRKYLPYAFTEQGIAMLSAILRSETAIKTSISIISAFVEMRRFIINNSDVFSRIETIEQRQIGYQLKTDEKFEQVFQAIENNKVNNKEDKSETKYQAIFYDGQVYDAYVFVSYLVKSAKSEIILIDNYIDDSVLTLLSKRDAGVNAIIYTKQTSNQFQLDLQRHNAQYPPIIINIFNKAHDRFLIIDQAQVFHFGASIKDLGKKWFAVNKMLMPAQDILGRL